MNRSGTSAVGATRMFDPLKINAKGAVELRDGTGEDYTAPCGAFLHDRQAVRAGEFLYLLDILGVGTELLSEVLALEVIRRAATLVKLLHSLVQGVGCAVPQQDGN